MFEGMLAFLRKVSCFARRCLAHFGEMWFYFYRHGGPMLAAAISFYFLLSAVPLALFGLSIAGMVVKSPQKMATIILGLANIQELLPDGAVRVGSFFRTFVEQAGMVNRVSLVLLLVFSGGVFLTVESAINRVFERHEQRPLWRQLLFAYILMFMTYLALLGSAAATWGAFILAELGVSVLGISYEHIGLFWKAFFVLAPTLWVSLFFTTVYVFIPHRRVRWRYALAGGFFAGIAWEVAKRLFALYIKYVVRFNQLYGGISAILATYVWVFYTAAIMLLGAELTMTFIRREEIEGEGTLIAKT